MTTDNWEGAQWVLSMWLVLRVTIFPMFGLAAKHPEKWAVWAGEYLATIINCSVLVFVLWWGGFWS